MQPLRFEKEITWPVVKSGGKFIRPKIILLNQLHFQSISKSKVGDRSQGQPEGSLFNSFYNKV